MAQNNTLLKFIKKSMKLRKTPLNWQLYVITDKELSKARLHMGIAKAAIAGGADIISRRSMRLPRLSLFSY